MDLAAAEAWMREALSEARKAEAEGEVPVGAILLLNGKIISRGHNHSIRTHDPTAHAEILALRRGAHSCVNYRLPGTILVVTIEPCIMCVGAMIQARVEELVYGAADPKAGAIQSCFQMADGRVLNHSIRITASVLEEECRSMMKEFFASRR
jgi:tRNA(adenine34) deaminase